MDGTRAVRLRPLQGWPEHPGFPRDVTRGLSGIDIGCGEEHNTRLLAERGARTVGIDISGNFVRHAREAEEEHPLAIRYEVASALGLPFEGASFDFAVAFMSLMDIPEMERVLAEVYRVIRPGGFLQFPIEHLCFSPPHRKTLRDEAGRAYARELGRLLPQGGRQGGRVGLLRRPARGQRGRAPLPRPAVPRFTRTLSEWLNLLVGAGFVLERFGEPYPGDEAVRERPGLQGARVVFEKQLRELGT